MIILLLIIAIAVGLFYCILQLDVLLQMPIQGIWKFVLVVIEMIIVGQILIKRHKLESEMGLILLKSRKGLQIIDRLAKNERMFNFLADAGNGIAYGLMSVVLMRKNVSLASLLTGISVLLITLAFVAPQAFAFLIAALNLGTVDKAATLEIAGENSAAILFMAALAIAVCGGLFLFTLSGIVLYGANVMLAIVKTLFFGVDVISTTKPGGTFLLPGVNLPFFEGVLAITIVMVVHEGAHAVLARIAKVPLLSAGLVFFGILPVGAFIEPDEKKLAKVERTRQTRVLVAGSASNLFTSFVLFFLFVGCTLLINNLNVLDTALGPAARFLYTTLGLAFALNFIVGAINLLPLPFFDGYRVMDLNIKNKIIVNALTYSTLFFFILNFLPWFFQK